MGFLLTLDQLQKLNTWRKVLSSSENSNWYATALKSSEYFNAILDLNFQNGKDLTPAQIGELFHQMKNLSGNRNLGSQLYGPDKISSFNKGLRLLLFGKDPIAERIDQFIDMEGISEVTMSHFLSMHNPKEFPFFSWQTYEMLDLSKEQQQQARTDAISENSISDPKQFNEETTNYLQHWIIFREVKRKLSLESYPQINILLIRAYNEQEVEGGGLTLSSVSVEKELYAPIKGWIEKNFGAKVSDRDDYYWIKETANFPRKGQLGQWSRPDIVFLEVNRFDMLPQRSVQLTSFEVKRADDASLSSVYETTAHQRWAHYSYLLVEVPNDETDLPENVITEASRFGIGLMKAHRVFNISASGLEHQPEYKLEEIVAPHRQNPEPKEQDAMIKDFFRDDERGAKKFKDAIGR